LGFGLGNLDGWDGDHSIHLLSAGSSLIFAMTKYIMFSIS
jgi:hypothetical protein